MLTEARSQFKAAAEHALPTVMPSRDARVRLAALHGASFGAWTGGTLLHSQDKEPPGISGVQIQTVDRTPECRQDSPYPAALGRESRRDAEVLVGRPWSRHADSVSGMTGAAQRRHSTRLCSRCRAAPVTPLVVAPRAHP